MSDVSTKIKEYENSTRSYLPLKSYTIIRIDGKAFSTYTDGFETPFDEDFIEMMNETAKKLCEEIQGVKMAYVQSDEISLVLTDFDKENTNLWFDGNIQKIASVSASIATQAFNFSQLKYMFRDALQKEIDIHVSAILADCISQANFDSRTFSIPSFNEVVDYFILRQKDAVKNSISMVAQSLFSHKQLEGKNSDEKKEMIKTQGVDWNIFPNGQQRGRIVLKKESQKEAINKKTQKISIVTRKSWEVEDAPLFYTKQGTEILRINIPQKK